MIIRFKHVVVLAALMTASAAFGEDAPKAADGDRAALEKFVHDFELLPGLGRPEGDLSATPPADLGPDPLGDVSNLMSSVHDDLAQMKTDQPVQQKQKETVDSLEKLIAALTPRGSGSGGSNNPSGQGRRASIIVSGTAKIDDLHAVENHGRQWPQLPPKERERILQSKTEGFPQGYEMLLQSYYQRLAQEQTVEEKAGETPSTTPGK